eukprot:6173349-Pleurochrysis_carterae.AAC.4
MLSEATQHTCLGRQPAFLREVELVKRSAEGQRVASRGELNLQDPRWIVAEAYTTPCRRSATSAHSTSRRQGRASCSTHPYHMRCGRAALSVT